MSHSPDPGYRWHPKLKGEERLEREDAERMAQLTEHIEREKGCPVCGVPVPKHKRGAYCGRSCRREATREQDRYRARAKRSQGG